MNDSTDLVAPSALRPAMAYTLSPAPAAARCSRGMLRFGPGDHPAPGVKTSVLDRTLPLSSTPPTATSLPLAAPVASAPRRVAKSGSSVQACSPGPRLQTSLVGFDSPPVYPPTAYSRPPNSANDEWSYWCGSGGPTDHVPLATSNRSSRSTAWSGLGKPPATAICPSQNAPATSVRATGITGPDVVDRAGAGAGAGDDFESSLPPPLHAPSATSASAITR